MPTRETVASDPVIREFLSRISPLRVHIEKMVLFGSRARGQESPWSDYDVLVVVDQRDRGLVDQLYDAVIQVLCSTEKEMSLKIFSHDQFAFLSHMKTPFMKNIEREGIPVG